MPALDNDRLERFAQARAVNGDLSDWYADEVEVPASGQSESRSLALGVLQWDWRLMSGLRAEIRANQSAVDARIAELGGLPPEEEDDMTPFKLLAQSDEVIEHTGTTDETAVVTVPMPADFGPFGVLKAQLVVQGDGTDEEEEWRARVYLGSTGLSEFDVSGGYDTQRVAAFAIYGTGALDSQFAAIGSDANGQALAEDLSGEIDFTITLEIDDAEEAVFITNYAIYYLPGPAA